MRTKLNIHAIINMSAQANYAGRSNHFNTQQWLINAYRQFKRPDDNLISFINRVTYSFNF